MSSSPCLSTSIPPDHVFFEPTKRIHDGTDVQFFLQSLAYRDVTLFVLQLNRSLVPRKSQPNGVVYQFQLDQEKTAIPQTIPIQQIIARLESFIADAPPDTGPRRFGNVSFRKWYSIVEKEIQNLLEEALPVQFHPAILEIKAYLLGSLGSPQRLDYGTGHELSFLVFLVSLWKIGYFVGSNSNPHNSSETTSADLDNVATVERNIVLHLFQPYLSLVRKLIITYTLEPAGSHGVWGLDDNSFLPYLFGSAQLCPPIPENDSSQPTPTPTSGSLSSAPEPSIVTKQDLVEKEAISNMYFSAIDFIYKVKRGPFWEHSPMLFDISGIKDGWGKINKGLIKMYDAEVLGKFPVVQHFPFGSLLQWEKDPQAQVLQTSTHTANQPLRDPVMEGKGTAAIRSTSRVVPGTTAPWTASPSTRAPPPPPGFVNGVTQAPWAKPQNARMPPSASQRFGIGSHMQSMRYTSQTMQPSMPTAKSGELETTDVSSETTGATTTSSK